MASTLKFEVAAVVGEYTNRDGETKKRYQNVGTVWENDKGQMSMRLESLPLSKDWNGWLSFFDPKPRDGAKSAPKPAAKPAQSSSDGFSDNLDDVPF